MSGRPETLFPLFAAITAVDGIGPKTGQILETAGIARPRDMLFTLPHAGVDRQVRDSIQGQPAPATMTAALASPKCKDID